MMASPDRNFVIELARVLARHYPGIEDSRPVANETANFDTTTIKSDFRSLFNWLNILSEAHRQSADGVLVHKLLERARQGFEDDPLLTQAFQVDWSQEGLGQLIAHTLSACELEWQRKLEQLLTLPKQTYNPQLDPPSALLQAKYEVVPFQYRGADLTSLRAWCDGEQPIALRLYHGVGGLGKTRLFLHFGRELKEQGWLSGFLNMEEAEKSLSAWDALLYQDKPMLLVVDYAETRLEPLKGLLKTVYQHFGKLPQKLRLVLLARSDGEWWDQLISESTELGNLLVGGASEVFAVEPVADSLEERQRLYQAAATSFAQFLNQPLPQDAIPDLTPNHFERALLVLMDALLALDPFQAKTGRTTTSLLEGVLNRERGYWRDQLEAKGFTTGLNPMIEGLENTMALVTLGRRVSDVETAIGLLQRDKNFEGKDYAECKSVAEILHTAYAEPDWVSSLQPDLLGEYLAYRVLSKDETVLNTAFEQGLPEGIHKTGLTVLSRLSQWHLEGATLLKMVLTSRSYLYPNVIEIAPVTGHRIADMVAELLEEQPDLELAMAMVDQIPTETVALRKLALVVTHKAAKNAQQSGDLLEYIRLFVNLGNRLGDIGQREAALQVTQEVVQKYRELAKTRPDVFLSDLAIGLTNLGVRLSDLGHQEAALRATQEAVEIRRELIKTQPDAVLPDLAMSLNNLGRVLTILGQREPALQATQEAVEKYRELAETRPGALLPDLARSLNNLGSNLSALGHQEAALRATQEAVEIRRELVKTQPDAFLPDLAGSLINLGIRLSNLGQEEAALQATQEGVEKYRELAKIRPDAFLPDLAASLTSLGSDLSALGQRGIALQVTQEAVAIRRELVKTQPDAFLPDLAGSLINLGIRLSDLGQREAALQAAQEAVEKYRELAKIRPDAFLPDLARCCGARGNTLIQAGQLTEACASFIEGIKALKQLFYALPQAFSSLMTQLVKSCLKAAQDANVEPDVELLNPIISRLQELQQDK